MHNLTAKDKFDMSDMSLFTWVKGDVADILDMCVHKYYDMIQVREKKTGFPLLQSKLGRFLGPCRNNDNMMTMNILTSTGAIVPRRTVILLTATDLNMLDENS